MTTIQGSQVTLEEAMKLAVQHHQTGVLPQAEVLYRAILEKSPQHPDANHNLGVIALQVGKPQLALPHLKVAMEANSSNVQFWLSYAEGLLLANQLTDAGAILSKASKLGISGNNFEALLSRVREAVWATKNPLFSALSLWGSGKTEQAIDWLTEYVRKHPKDPQGLTQLGEFLRHDESRLNQAIHMLERSIKLQKDSSIAWLSYGTALSQLKRTSEAKRAFRTALQINPNLYQAANDLAVILMQEGNNEEAIRLLEKATGLLPNNPEMHMNLARALAKEQRFKDAELVARHAASLDSSGACGANMFLAALGVEPTPEKIPGALLQKLYSQRAASWDAKVNSGPYSYRGADLVASVLLTEQKTNSLDILDAGCGTGLVGFMLRERARRLDGVDMSQPMLDRAKEKGVYDTLVCGDMIELLNGSVESYDAIVSAATLIHFADLTPVFQSAASALRINGKFVFTVFPNDKDPAGYSVDHLDGLAQGGCYVHGQEYLKGLARKTGFEIELLRREIHEFDESEKPKECFLVSLRRNG